MKSYLFVLCTAPHNGIAVQEMLDVVLTTAAFEQKVALLLLDDAVFALKKKQQPEKYQLKDTLSVFRALEIYDVTEIYAETESLQERGLVASNFGLPIQSVPRQSISALMKQHDFVVSG